MREILALRVEKHQRGSCGLLQLLCRPAEFGMWGQEPRVEGMIPRQTDEQRCLATREIGEKIVEYHQVQ